MKELETNNITKEEMKEMLKEGLTPITNVLLGKEKETVNVETQADKDIEIQEKKKVKEIKSIEHVIESEELDTLNFGSVSSLTVTEDKRIVSGGADGNISISSYNVHERTWKREIHKNEAHNNFVNSLCILDGNRLLSCDSIHHSFKLWSLSDVDLKLIKKIKGHTDSMLKVIPLSKKRFASCSRDNTVKIWKDNKKCKYISTLHLDSIVSSILQLRGKEVLVSTYGEGYDSSLPCGVSFWNINDYTKQHTITGHGALLSTHMIELSNGNIALSSNIKPHPIVIIDSSSYQVKKEFQLKEYITSEWLYIIFLIKLHNILWKLFCIYINIIYFMRICT